MIVPALPQSMLMQVPPPSASHGSVIHFFAVVVYTLLRPRIDDDCRLLCELICFASESFLLLMRAHSSYNKCVTYICVDFNFAQTLVSTCI